MADEAKKTEDKSDAGGGEMLDKILKGVDSACTAMDSISKRMDAMEGRQDSFEENFKKEKADADDEEEKDEPKRVAADKKAKKDSDDKDEKKADAEDDKEKEKVAEKKDADDKDKDEKKEEAKSDSSALRAEIESLKARMVPRSDADYRALISNQAKYDTVYQAFGDSAPRFLDGEMLSAYRRRVTADMQKHSPAWKSVDLGLIKSDEAFDIAETQIMSDSMGVALNPTDIPVGILREIKTRDKTGREISTFFGRSKDWMGSFSGPGRKAKIIARPNGNNTLN